LAFKFGIFIEVDLSTKNMLSDDVARIKIVTKKTSIFDSIIVKIRTPESPAHNKYQGKIIFMSENKDK
jgi:hypothetical protein